MRKSEIPSLWVVYRMNVRGTPSSMHAVCEQGEWEAMERAQPGHHVLIQANIANEGAAEQLARIGTANENPKKPSPPKRPRPSLVVAATTAAVPEAAIA